MDLSVSSFSFDISVLIIKSTINSKYFTILDVSNEAVLVSE